MIHSIVPDRRHRAFQALFTPGMIDEDPSHCLGGGSEEMSAVLPGLLLGTARRSQASWTRAVACKVCPDASLAILASSQSAQFVIDNRKKFVRGACVTMFESVEDAVNSFMLSWIVWRVDTLLWRPSQFRNWATVQCGRISVFGVRKTCRRFLQRLVAVGLANACLLATIQALNAPELGDKSPSAKAVTSPRTRKTRRRWIQFG